MLGRDGATNAPPLRGSADGTTETNELHENGYECIFTYPPTDYSTHL